jgi:hypothetical protein
MLFGIFCKHIHVVRKVWKSLLHQILAIVDILIMQRVPLTCWHLTGIYDESQVWAAKH